MLPREYLPRMKFKAVLACSAMCFAAALGNLAGCRGPGAEAEVEVRVDHVGLDETSNSPVVVLEGRRHAGVLPIWVGVVEAQAIVRRLQGIEPQRPLTHDLMEDVMDRAGVELRKVLIHDVRDQVYFARIFLRSHGKDLEIDSRPSDAIVLALRFGKPIYVRGALLQPAGASLGSAGDPEPLEWRGMTLQGLTGALAESFGLDATDGVLVSAVNDPARTRLQRGDVILEVDGSGVRDVEDLIEKLDASGGRADLSVQRNGRRIRVAFPSGRCPRGELRR